MDVIVFPGSDGHFCLYEDAGDGYGYEKGDYALLPMHWDDARHQLTLDKRQGGYAHLPALRVRLFGGENQPVSYQGQEMTLALTDDE